MGALGADLHGRDLAGQGEATFARGAALENPAGLFNSGLGRNSRRAIDIREGEEIGGGR